MKVEKHLTINIGGYQSIKIGAVECDDFSQADQVLAKEILEIERRMGTVLDAKIKRSVVE